MGEEFDINKIPGKKNDKNNELDLSLDKILLDEDEEIITVNIENSDNTNSKNKTKK